MKGVEGIPRQPGVAGDPESLEYERRQEDDQGVARPLRDGAGSDEDEKADERQEGRNKDEAGCLRTPTPRPAASPAMTREAGTVVAEDESRGEIEGEYVTRDEDVIDDRLDGEDEHGRDRGGTSTSRSPRPTAGPPQPSPSIDHRDGHGIERTLTDTRQSIAASADEMPGEPKVSDGGEGRRGRLTEGRRNQKIRPTCHHRAAK